jgi:hypothetical protein
LSEDSNKWDFSQEESGDERRAEAIQAEANAQAQIEEYRSAAVIAQAKGTDGFLAEAKAKEAIERIQAESREKLAKVQAESAEKIAKIKAEAPEEERPTPTIVLLVRSLGFWGFLILSIISPTFWPNIVEKISELLK